MDNIQKTLKALEEKIEATIKKKQKQKLFEENSNAVYLKNLEAFKAEEKRISDKNTFLAPCLLGGSPESEVRRQVFANAALGAYQMADPDGNWIDITDE